MNEPPQPNCSFLAHEGGTTSASFSPDGTTLATGGYDCVLRLWDVETWRQKDAFADHRRGEVAFSPDGQFLISGGLHKNALVFDTDTWQSVQELHASNGVWAMAFRPDGSEVVLVESDTISRELHHRPIEFWRTNDWTMTGTADVGTDNVYSLALSPDGRRAALAHYPNGLVSIWSTDFKETLLSFSAHKQATWGVAFSPDGRTLATGGADNVARLWDTVDWELRVELPHQEMKENPDYRNGVLCVVFSPDGTLLVTGGLDGTLSVWSMSAIA